MSVNRLVLEVEATTGEFLVGPCVCDFRFNGGQLFRILEVEPVLQNGRARITIIIGNCVVHPRLRFAIGLDDYLKALLGSNGLVLRNRGAAFHLG
jgi:hypothetical protein